MNKIRLLGSSALYPASFIGLTLAIATPALAQEAATTDGSVADEAPAEVLPATSESASQSDEAIVVTGSRIRRTEFNSPDPLTLIDPDLAKNEGKFSTAEMLQSSPVAAGSSQITSAISSNFVTNGGFGAQTISLRGLGAERTLVLLNGRRAGPAGTRGAVSSFDLNVLPQSIVSRVEVLKTGASSVYGSDAVAGVVNLITKTNTDGLQLDGNISVPFQKGGEEFRMSALWGKDFGRGHIMLAGDYFKQKELARGDRKYLECPEAYVFKPNSRERADLVDPRTGQYKCEDLRWGHVWTYDLDYLYDGGPGNLYLEDGTYTGAITLIQFQYPGENLGLPTYGAPTNPMDLGLPAGWFPTGYDRASLAVQNSFHPFALEQTIIPETERYTAFAQGAFEITDNVEVYGELLHNRRKTYQNGWRQIWQFGYTSDFDGIGFGDPFAEGWTGYLLLSPTGITNQSDSSQRVDYTRAVGGAHGTLAGALSGWTWDTHVQYSRSDGRYRTQQVLADAIATQNLRTESCVGTTTPISNRPCIDLPWLDPYFLAGQLTPEHIAFLFDWEEGKTIYTQVNSEASVSGDLISLPAGPVGVAVGLTARRDRINDTPGHITLADNAWGNTGAGITAGESMTKEAFAELNIPVIHNTPGIQEFTISAAARLTNVKATRASDGASHEDNGNWTYKIGANWAVTDWLRFRGSYGTSFRAPALFEQFLADQTSFTGQRNIDPCIGWGQNLNNGLISQELADNCAAQGVPSNHIGNGVDATIITGGGLGVLESESSTAKTASVIFTPTVGFLPNTRLNVAVDYFDIHIKGEIAQLGAYNIIYGCLTSDSFPDDPLCDLFERGQTGAPHNIDFVRDSFINVNSQRNRGFDLTTNIRHNLGRFGNLSFLAQMTWQVEDTTALFEGTEVSDNGEAGDPKWVGDFNLVWENRDGWSVFYGLDVIGATSNEADYIEDNGDLCRNSTTRGEHCVDLTAKAKFYHNLSITKRMDRFDLTVGISNLFDTRPPRVSVRNGGEISMMGPVVAASQYDFLGRRAFVNVTARF